MTRHKVLTDMDAALPVAVDHALVVVHEVTEAERAELRELNRLIWQALRPELEQLLADLAATCQK